MGELIKHLGRCVCGHAECKGALLTSYVGLNGGIFRARQVPERPPGCQMLSQSRSDFWAHFSDMSIPRRPLGIHMFSSR